MSLKVGQSYGAEDLADLCGCEKEVMYDYLAFVGERATVIAIEEGNGVVKITEIIRQKPAKCSECGWNGALLGCQFGHDDFYCPNCGKEAIKYD